MEIIIGRQGSQKRTISDPTVSRKHCKIIVNADGTYTIENLSDSGTKVDGKEIIRTTVNLNSQIQLGQNFTAKLGELIGNPEPQRRPQTAAQSPTSTTKEFSISHLQQIWEDYNQANLEKAESQRKTNLIRTGLGIFTMCAMPMIFFFGPIGYVLTGIGVLGNIYSFAGMRNSETAEEKQRRQDEFDDAWVCPNPDCKRTLPARNYKLLVRNIQSCPYCKCKYIN